MKYRHRKNKLMTGIASLLFFVVASLCFGFALQGRKDGSLLGFHINEDATAILDLLPFFNSKAETQDLYPYDDVQNQVILVNFPDRADHDGSAWLNETKLQRADEVLNGDGFSLRRYIEDVSKGSVRVNSVFYGHENGMDGFMASHDLSYYIGHQNERLGREIESQREEELLREMIDALNDTQSLQNKSAQELDTNDDGYVDNMTFVIRGNKNNDYNLLWPHQYSFTSGKGKHYPTVVCDNGNTELKVRDYMVIISGDTAIDGTGNSGRGIFTEHSDIGVIAHEYLHIFGFPDMYHNYKYENGEFVPLASNEQRGDPLGQWEIMDNTIFDHPQNPLYYTNMTYSPWKEELNAPLVINASTQNVVLHSLDYARGSGTMAAIIRVDNSVNPLGEDQYFMVEYREQEGWDQRLPNHGLLVYRINKAANLKNEESAIVRYCTNLDNGRLNHCGNMFGPPDEVYIFRPGVNGIDEQTASNDYRLSDAVLRSDSKWTSLGKTLEEVSGYHPGEQFSDTIYFSDGSNSGIVISNVKEGDHTITFDIEVPLSKVDKDKPIISDSVTGDGLNGQWTKGPAELSLSISDVGSGIASVEIITKDGELANTIDPHSDVKTYTANESLNELTYTFYPVKNGTYRIQATDHAGNVSAMKTIVVKHIDTEAPSAEIGEISRTNNEIQIPITLKDAHSGIDVSSARYATMGLRDDQESLTYPHPIDNDVIVLPGDFEGNVCVAVSDHAGNTTPSGTCWAISDDHEKPILTMDDSQTDWTNENRTINVSAIDQGNDAVGIHYLEVTTEDGVIRANDPHYRKDSRGANGSDSESFTFEIAENGTYDIRVCDYAGNCAEHRLEVANVDHLDPVIDEIKVKADRKWGLFPTGAHSIHIVAADEPQKQGSGIKEYRYQLVQDDGVYDSDRDSQAWQSVPEGTTIHTDEQFVGTIYAYVVDHAGNESEILQERIERTSKSRERTNENVTQAQIPIFTMNDPEVFIQSEASNPQWITASLGADYMSTHELYEGYDVTLWKNEEAYVVTNRVTIRLHVDQEIKDNDTLQLIAIDENGKCTSVDSVREDDYLQFESESPTPHYAIVVDKQDARNNQANTGGAKTGVADLTSCYAFLCGISFILSIWFYLNYRKEF